MELLTYAISILVILFIAWLFSWRIPAWIAYLIIICGVLLLIGYIIGIGFKFAVGG